ncbi:transketolase [Staphylococcus pseudintermedius]|nr:transketolase [Staphylococcus pseudintermedius]
MENIKYLNRISKILRKYILEMLYYSESGHPGGSLSIADVLTYLYVNQNVNFSSDSNRLILSKGHAAPALYSLLILCGKYSKDHISQLRKNGSPFQGHPDSRYIPFLEFSSGSLGQNLSVGAGLSLSDTNNKKTFVIIGDGEIQEGQIWESLLFSSHHNLENLYLIIDNNGLQLDGKTDDIISLGSLDDKLRSFGWNTIKIDGHSFEQLDYAFNIDFKNTKPTCIITNTIKGKGVSFMEDVVEWHSIHIENSKPLIKRALKELEEQ